MAILIFSIPGNVFWPYFEGAVILILGLAAVSWSEVREARGLDKLVPFGPVLFAVPMAVFSGDHFGAAKFVAMVVPSWMPWHIFWVYFVGVALVAAALSMVTKRQAQLAATLLGIMLFLFVLMIHIPSCFAAPHDKTRFTLVARELALSAGALSLAATLAQEKLARGGGTALSSPLWNKVVVVARLVIGLVIIDFGVQQFLFPDLAPGIPHDGARVIITLPAWIPAHAFWAYLTGAIFVACGIALLFNRRTRLAATVLGLTVLVLIAFAYLPLTISKASDVANGLNYLAIHFAWAGMALLLAGALPKTGLVRSP